MNSEQQRKLFGMILAAKRGQVKPPSKPMGAAQPGTKDFASKVEKRNKREGITRTLIAED